MNEELLQKLIQVITTHYAAVKDRTDAQREVDLKNLILSWPMIRAQVDDLRNEISLIKNRLTNLEQ